MWGPPAALMAAIFAVSSVPNLDTSTTGISDKTLHSWTYSALGALLVRAFARAEWRGVTPAAALRAWVGAVLWGAFDELHQALVPGRSTSWEDLVADAAGAGLAVVVVLAAARLARRGRAV